MSITYPISLPTSPGFKRFVMRARSTAAISVSPFTLQQQVYQHQGEIWEAECTLPPMVRADAEAWIASLLSLRGRWGTFVLGDPAGKTPRGTALGNPAVDSEPQAGTSVATLAWNASQTGALKVGDYSQIAKNYLVWPRHFDNAVWAKGECTITATDIMAPNGDAEADRATPTGGATDAAIYQATTAMASVANQTFTGSIWLKAATSTIALQLVLRNQAGAIIVNQNSTITTSWQHFNLTGTMGSADTEVRFYVGSAGSWTEAKGAVDLWGGCVYSPAQNARLHKNLGLDRDSDSNGRIILDIFPRLREAPPDFSAILTTSPVGLFRLAENVTEWDLDEVKNFGMGFKVIEAI